MGCLFVTFAAFFPRFAVLFIWLARPALFEAALGSALVAVLGIVFLPFTTLMYVLLWTPDRVDRLRLGVGLPRVPDRHGGPDSSGYANRKRAGGFYSGGSTGGGSTG